MDLGCQKAPKAIIRRHRDVHTGFTGNLLGEGELAGLLNTAHAVPNVSNNQPWGFVAVYGPTTLDAFTEHVTQYRRDYTNSLDGEQWERFDPIRIEGIRESGMGIVATCNLVRFGPDVLGRHTISNAGTLLVVCAV